MMATANMEEELTCSICLELYKDPRLLPCHHSICKSCLVALRSKQDNDSDIWLHCPSCRHLFEAKDEAHIESLPKNFTLASIVCKFRESLKGDNVFACDVCEDDKKGRAIKKCFQCQVNYCRVCLEHLHPKTGVFSSHRLVHIMDAYGAEHKEEEFSPAFPSSVSEIQYVDTPKCDRLRRERYCMSCDEIYAKGDQSSIDGIHEHHVTTEMRSAVKQKREEVKCILARLLGEDQDLAKGVADLTSLIETIRKKVEGKKIELVQRFGELTEEVERRKLTAENRMEEEMKTCITSLESRLYELEDDKAKTKIKIADVFELSSITNDDAHLFLIKLKKLQNEIGPVTEDRIQRATIETKCDLLLRSEQLMNKIISDAMCDICPSERRLLVRDPNQADMDIASKHVPMEIKVTSVQLEGTVSADVEWVATQPVDHYEISYFCDPRETVLQRDIVETRCRLTTLKSDSEYTVRVTAYLSNGKTSFDSAIFKTDPKVKEPNPVNMNVSSNHANMAIKITKVQKDGTVFADVEWVSSQPVDHYEISYFCDPRERILQQDIVETRCRLSTLKWDSEYTVRVTAYLSNGKTSFDSAIFKTDPKVKEPNPVNTNVASNHENMAIKITKVQKDGTVFADVKWVSTQPVDHYAVSYFCDLREKILQQGIVETRCRLSTLKWNSEYTVRVTAYLPNGKTSFDSAIFKTDPKVKDPNLVDMAKASKPAFMAIKVTKFQRDGQMFADVEWSAMHGVDHYEISYFCDPKERILLEDIVETRCRLATLRWDTEYIMTVTAYLLDKTTSHDLKVFKTDPKVKDTKPTIMDISPRRVKMSLKVTNIQKAGIMSADVKWTAKYEPCEYEVLYYCNPDEVVVLKNIAENRCMLTNLRWDSTYIVKVTTELEDGTRVFNEKVFKTDLQVKCFPMSVLMVCNEKIAMLGSHNEFKASNRIKEWRAPDRLGKFSGIVITPVLTEDVQFWTMNIELSIFEEGRNNQIFLDFGIIAYGNLEHCCTLRYNREAYSCSVIQSKGRQFHLVFNNHSISEGDSYLLPLELYQRSHLCYGFLYDFLNHKFAVVDCLSQNVLHVFDDAEFCSINRPIFAVCPYHTELKMRVKIKLDRGHDTNEDVSSWMQKISNF